MGTSPPGGEVRPPVGVPAAAGVSISIAPRTILTFVGLVALTWCLVAVGGTLLVIFVSVFLAVVLSPVVDAATQRLNLGRGGAASLVVLGLAVLVGLLMLVALSPLIDTVRSFSDNLPKIVREIDNSALGKQLNSHSDVNETLQKHASGIVSGVGKAAGGAFGVAASAFGVVIMAFSVIFMTLFLVKDLPSYRESLLSLMGNESAVRWHRIANEVITTTSRYMIGNIVISLICATIYGTTALILGLPYPLALALSVSTTALIIFVIVIVVYQQFENYVLQPTIIGKAADISGFLVILSVLFWGALFGVVGAVVGVPITAATLIIVEELTADRRARIAAGRPAEPDLAT
jgi:predicted PurR-regulated permease PerM